MRPGMRNFVGVGVVAGLLAALAGQASGGPAGPRGAPVIGPEIRISSGPADEVGIAVAWNGADDEYLVVWRDDRKPGLRGWDIYGRRVGSDGAAIGADFRISGPGATSDEYGAAVAWNATANEYLVVWQDGRNEATRANDIYGRRVGPDGAAIGDDFRISGPGATLDEYTPAVAWNGTANEYLVVWRDQRNVNTRGGDIYGRRIGADGSALGPDFRISGTNATRYDLDPAVAWNGTTNEYLVVWQDERNTATRKQDIYGRRVAADGTRLGGDFRICGPNATSYDLYPAVAWNGTANEFLVVWQDDRSEATRGQDIYGRRVAADGARLGGDLRISGTNSLTYQQAPTVAWGGTANQYLVTWHDDRNNATRFNDVYGRLVGADGAGVGGDFRISGPDATAADMFPAVAWNGTDNQFLVVWEDWRNEATSGGDVYGRRLSG